MEAEDLTKEDERRFWPFLSSVDGIRNLFMERSSLLVPAGYSRDIRVRVTCPSKIMEIEVYALDKAIAKLKQKKRIVLNHLEPCTGEYETKPRNN